ncbi:MFS transporter [Paenibacillus nanensis]|nr:MFS transporter [Paenibacillus nanensis]
MLAAKLKSAKSAASNNHFAILLTSILFVSIGNKIYELVLPLLMYELTHSSVSMTSMRTAELLPNFFFAIAIGVLVDRANKKRWAMWMLGSQAVLLILFTFLYKSGSQQLMFYYMIGFLLMTFGYGFFNVQVSLVKQTAQPSKLTEANAQISLVETLVTVMGPALTGLLLLFSDVSDGILITALLFILCLLSISLLPAEAPRLHRPTTNMVHEFREGWRAFRSNRTLFHITIFVMFINCSFTVVQTCLVFHAKDVLQLSSSMLAVILSAAGIGGLAGSLMTSKLRARVGLGKIYGFSIILHAIGSGLLVFSESMTLFVTALFLIGLATSFHGISVYTMRHEQTPSHLMGRIAGITGTIFRIGMPITMFLSGWIIEIWGTQAIFTGAVAWNAFFLLLYVRSALWKER